MKVKNLFRKANFSGLLLTEELYQSKLVHKAKIEIIEAGSTAGISGQFKCDHPFLFVIHDQKFNEILFAGVYHGPNGHQNV